MLVINVGVEDRKAIKAIMARHGHKSKAGAVRLAIQYTCDRTNDLLSQASDIKVGVLKESLPRTKEHNRFFAKTERMPIAIELSDQGRMNKIKRSIELDNYSQVVRFSLRFLNLMESRNHKAT